MHTGVYFKTALLIPELTPLHGKLISEFTPQIFSNTISQKSQKQNCSLIGNLLGDIQKWRHRGRGYPKFMRKSDLGGGGGRWPHRKKLCIDFYFSLVYGQCSSSCALVVIPVMVSFQEFAWVRTWRLNEDLSWLS